jgi:isopropylmalate/homocitrate/citramalate synthase
MRDARIAVETGVDGLDVVIGTSSFLREHSHGKDMAYIEKTAIEVIEYIKSKGLEVRCESIRPSQFHVVWKSLVRANADDPQSPARIPSGPTWSTSCLCTRPLTRLA